MADGDQLEYWDYLRECRREEIKTLPIKSMLADANVVESLAWPEGLQNDLVNDLACHVSTLSDELRRACEACAAAHNFIDRWADMIACSEETAERDAVFQALSQFTRTCGHKFVSAYAEKGQ